MLLLLVSAPVVAAEIEQVVNIPESEPSDDVVVIQPDIKTKPAKSIKKKALPAPVVKIEEKPKAEEPPKESNLVILQGINKVMGRVYTLEIPLGTVAQFENLEIIARKCQKNTPQQLNSSNKLANEQVENAAFLEIREVKVGEEPKQIFLGWMFFSSPSLSSLEHPVYDVTVLSCEVRADLEGNVP